jgi:DNA-binding transcriptional MocR family regulator
VLAVSRTTVISAFDVLKQEGWLESRRGSGTRVRHQSGSEGPAFDDPIASLGGNPLFRGGLGATIDLATAAVECSDRVLDAIAGFNRDDARRMASGAAYSPEGVYELRERVATYLSEQGVPSRAANVLVTTGTQQAISLLAGHFLRASDTVIVEDPSSPGALDAFRSTGARARSVSVGPDGADLYALEELARGSSPRAIYVVPTFQNPTGTVMPLARRKQLAVLADQLQIPLIEDLSHSWLSLEGEAPAPIASHASGDRTVIVDSMSKLFWSGLRIGWIRSSEGTIRRLSRAKALADLGTPVLSQHLAARLLTDVVDTRRERVTWLGQKLDLTHQLLSDLLPDWTWDRPSGGLSLWLRLPAGSARGFAQLALRFGVVVVPGPLFSVDDHFDDRIRLTFGRTDAELETGVRRLVRAWRAYESSDHPEPMPVEVLA